MKNKPSFIENLLKTSLRIYVYSTLAIILALVTFIILNYCQYYVHEFGHASAAVLYTMGRQEPSVSINFTYIDYKIPLAGVGLKVPQQTITNVPRIMWVYGVLFTIMFYAAVSCGIMYLLTRIRRLRENKRIGLALVGVVGLLILNDIVSNLFCGTDGLDIYCSNSFLMVFSGVVLFFMLVVLGFFYIELILLSRGGINGVRGIKDVKCKNELNKKEVKK